MLAAGDFDSMRVILDYYMNIKIFLQLRTQAYWNHSGIWTTETHTLFGAYSMSDYGCNRPATYPTPYEASGYLHVDQGGDSGSPEYSIMAFDYYAVTGDAQYLPLAFASADYFMYHYLGNVSADGKVVVWPAQVLETYWCAYDTVLMTWTNCCADDAPTISGMLTLFEKLRMLPSTLTTPEQRAAWENFANVQMPDLPLTPDGTIAYARILSSGSHNHEGPDLYAMHPHRVFTRGREVATGLNISIGVNTFYTSSFRDSNSGWAYSINAAALLGLSDIAAPMVISRALVSPAVGYRFPAFAPHEQDYDPSADHYANMMRAMQEMLLQSGEDGFENSTIVLLPAWPCAWDVEFTLFATGNTTVSVSYVGGKLISLDVQPTQRASAVKWGGCVGTPTK
jgi:hypothetical protein